MILIEVPYDKVGFSWVMLADADERLDMAKALIEWCRADAPNGPPYVLAYKLLDYSDPNTCQPLTDDEEKLLARCYGCAFRTGKYEIFGNSAKKLASID